MTHRKKIKKSAKIMISALIILTCIGLIFAITKPKQESEPVSGNDNKQDTSVYENDLTNNNEPSESSEGTQIEEESGSQAQLIENEGDIEIIIPDDQESDGF